MSVINTYYGIKGVNSTTAQHFFNKQKEATYIYKLWYPRPRPSDNPRDNPKIKDRVSKLLDYGYKPEELELWFRLNDKNLRRATNTEEANIIWEDIKAIYHQCCAYCGAKTKSLTKDHVDPVSKGGKDRMYNIVPACKHCNSSKNAKHLEDWGKFKMLQLHLLGFQHK